MGQMPDSHGFYQVLIYFLKQKLLHLLYALGTISGDLDDCFLKHNFGSYAYFTGEPDHELFTLLQCKWISTLIF